MQKNKKRGFTIVELVIVIAVIAILAAVLIPTFSNIIKKANISSDKQLARNMNAALAAADAEGVVVEDISDVLQIVNAAGYILENLNPATEGYYFVWDEETNQILFINDSYEVIFNSRDFSEDKVDWWCTVGSVAEIEKISGAGISLYFEKDITGDLELEKVVGFDTGYFTLTGDLSISGDDAVTVVLKGNIVGNNVTINAPNATIKQYGSINGNDTVTQIASASFDVFGYISGKLSAVKGHVEVLNSGNVATIELPDDTTATVTVSGIVNALDVHKADAAITISGGEVKIVNTNGLELTTVTNNGYIAEASGGGSINLTAGSAAVSDQSQRTYTLKIATRSQLENFRDMVNGGQTFDGITVELTADIDLSGEPWIPIGLDNRKLVTYNTSYTSYFSGIFDGKEHSILGLTNEGYIPAGSSYTTNSQGITGYCYGLLGCTYNAIVKNLNMTNVNIIELYNNSSFCVGSIIGAAVGNITVDNCTINGSINGTDSVGGVAGYIWVDEHNPADEQVVSLSNCIVNADITASGKRCGGIVGATMINYGPNAVGIDGTSFTITNCSVSGSITCYSTTGGAGGLFCASHNPNLYGWPDALTTIPLNTSLTISSNNVSATINSVNNPAKAGKYEGYATDGFEGTNNTFTGTLIGN